MRAGALRHRVILERPTEQQEGGGQVIDTYEPVTTQPIAAQVETLTVRESFAAAQVQAGADTRIRIRFRDDVDEKWRVRHITRYASPIIEHLYDVMGVIPDMKTGRKELQLICMKRVAEGWRAGYDAPTPSPPDDAILGEDGQPILSEDGGVIRNEG